MEWIIVGGLVVIFVPMAVLAHWLDSRHEAPK